MIEAQIFINVASPEDGQDDDAPYVIDGRRLRGASRLLTDLQELGWSVTFAPHGYLHEGYVEWIATKRFADLYAARAEVEALDCVREVSADVADPSAVLCDPIQERRPPGPTYLRYTMGAPAPERWRLGTDPYGRYVDVPVPAAARRSIRLSVPTASGNGDHPPALPSIDSITVCEADGREVSYWAVEQLKQDPEEILAAIFACVLGFAGPTTAA